jgi:hypothetical protein
MSCPEELNIMGGESANEWVLPAIKGEEVPPDQRQEFSMVDVQGGHGSANIPCLQAATAAWWGYHHDKGHMNNVLDAWIGYMNLNQWYTKEPFSCFRYGSWIRKSYFAMEGLCRKLGEDALMKEFQDYLRFDMLVAALSAGWGDWQTDQGMCYPVARGGARSWVAPKGDSGYYDQPPYPHLCEMGSYGVDFSNLVGRSNKASWETHPEIQEMKNRFGINKWVFFTSDEKAMMKRLAKTSSRSTQSDNDVALAASLIMATGARAKIGVSIAKTTQGVAFICHESASSGSTSFKYGSVWYKNQRPAGECFETWADQMDKSFSWTAACGYARRADVGGRGRMVVLADGVRIECQAKGGTSASGATVPPDSYWDQSLGDHSIGNPDNYRQGWRPCTLKGSIIWHVEIKKNGQGVFIHDGGDPVDPPVDPPPTDIPPGGWNTVITPHQAHMKMNNEQVMENYVRTQEGRNHMVTKECAVEQHDVAAVAQQLKAIIDSW